MITQPYVNFILPDAGGNVKPISNGTIYIGKEGLDPKLGNNPIYYRDNEGTEVEISSPLYLNMTGVIVDGPGSSNIINPYTKAPISMLILNKNGDLVWNELRGVSQFISTTTVGQYSGLSYSSVSNMKSGTPLSASLGDKCCTGLGWWEIVSYTTAVPLDNGLYAKPIGDIYVSDFGFVYDFFVNGSNNSLNPNPTSNDQAIDDAVAVSDSMGYALTRDVTGGGTFFGTSGKLVFPVYPVVIDSTKNFESLYSNVDFNNCIFLPSSTFDLTTYALNLPSYVTEYKNLGIAKFDLGFTVSNNNLNIGNVKFKNLRAIGVDKLMDVDTRSTTLSVEDYRFDNVRLVAEVHSCDKMVFNGAGWLSAGTFKADQESHFKLHGTFSPSLHLDDFFYVPAEQAFSKCAIVNLGENGAPASNSARVYIDNALAGAEPGRISLVNNYLKGTTGRGTYINVSDSSSFTAGTACVRLFDIPNAVAFTNTSGGIDESHVESAIFFDEQYRTFEQAEDGINSGVIPEIWFNGYTFNNFTNLPRANMDSLNKYVRSPNETFRAYAKGVTTTPVEVVVPREVSFARSKSFRVRATNVSNPGTDRYTEVIAIGNYQGTVISYDVIKQGATVAPKFSHVNGKLFVQSTSGTNDFAIDLTQICETTEAYL